MNIEDLKATLGWQSIVDSTAVFFVYGFFLTIFGHFFGGLEKELPSAFILLLEGPLSLYTFSVIAFFAAFVLFITEKGWLGRFNRTFSFFAKSSCRASSSLGIAIPSSLAGISLALVFLSLWWEGLSILRNLYLDLAFSLFVIVVPFLVLYAAILSRMSCIYFGVLAVGWGFFAILLFLRCHFPVIEFSDQAAYVALGVMVLQLAVRWPGSMNF